MNPQITEEGWLLVSKLRCRSKQGERLSPQEHELCFQAWREDHDRYCDMDQQVFEATKPFGSR